MAFLSLFTSEVETKGRIYPQRLRKVLAHRGKSLLAFDWDQPCHPQPLDDDM